MIEHRHDDLPLDHPHLRGERTHAHAYIIDDSHRRWAHPWGFDARQPRAARGGSPSSSPALKSTATIDP